MIAGDWPNGAGRNLIRPPLGGTSERARGRALLLALSTVPTCTRIIHGECIINASRIRDRLPADTI